MRDKRININIYNEDDIDIKNVFVNVESKQWKRPKPLILENLSGILNIKLNEDIKDRNVTSVEFINQDKNPSLSPNMFDVNLRTHIAVDENYLYIWIPTLEKWKRIVLSDWISEDLSIFKNEI